MTTEEIADRLIAIVKEEFDELSDLVVSKADVIQEKISLNSLNLAILLTSLELEFNVCITSEDVKTANTFQDLAEIISENREDA